jgi:glutaredoxin-like protein
MMNKENLMPLIPDNDQQKIREHFENNLTGDVGIVMFTERVSPIIIPGQEQCEMCEQTEELLKEVTALSDKLSLTVHDIKEAKEEADSYKIDRVPAFILKGASRGQVRYFGIPAGYEFSTLIADLIDVSKGVTNLSEETLEFLASLTEDVNIKVFTTPG